MSAGPRAENLRAVSVPLDPRDPFDPVTLAGPHGLVFSDATSAWAGRGVALRLELPEGLEDPGALREASRALQAIQHEDRTGSGVGPRVTAFGALPFERGDPGCLLVPRLTFGHLASGASPRQWVTVVAPAPGPSRSELRRIRGRAARAAVGGDRPEPGPPALLQLAAEPAPELYADAVAKALTGIEAGTYSKVVLGRRLDARFSGPLDPGAVLRRLREAEPLCTLFAFPIEGGGRFLGATPELLVAKRGNLVTCHPLAGTLGVGAGQGDDPALDRFLASPKDRAEHEAVVEAILEVLRARCRELRADPAPTLVRLHSVAHLGTLIEGRLSRTEPPVDVLHLLADLHPTPAVGGVPRGAALHCIHQLEPFRRERWAGPVGWVDAAGDGRFMVGIRSASLSEGPGPATSARLWAGAGIVAGSQPEAELAETTVKLAPVLEALSPGSAG